MATHSSNYKLKQVKKKSIITSFTLIVALRKTASYSKENNLQTVAIDKV